MRRANLCRRFVLCEAARRWNVGIIGTCVISSVYSTNAPPCPGPLFMLDLITWHASKKLTVALQRRISRTGKVPEIKKKKCGQIVSRPENSLWIVQGSWNGRKWETGGQGGGSPGNVLTFLVLPRGVAKVWSSFAGTLNFSFAYLVLESLAGWSSIFPPKIVILC